MDKKWPESQITLSVVLVVSGCVVAGVGDLTFDSLGYLSAFLCALMQVCVWGWRGAAEAMGAESCSQLQPACVGDGVFVFVCGHGWRLRVRSCGCGGRTVARCRHNCVRVWLCGCGCTCSCRGEGGGKASGQ